MIRSAILVLAFILVSVGLPTRTQARPDLAPAALQQDLDVLKRAVEEAHGGLYRFASKAEVDKAFDAARAQLGTPRSHIGFIGILSEALAVIRDGHMQLQGDDATAKAMTGGRLLPLRVAYENGRLIVTHNDSPADRTIAPGMELRAIIRRATADVIRAILSKLSPDGFIETGKAWRLARSLPQTYWLYEDQSTTFDVVAQAAGKPPVTAKLDGVVSAERADKANPVNTAFIASAAKLAGPEGTVSVDFPRGSDVGVLRVRAFGGGTFLETVAKAFDTIRERGARALILDLRGNGGGVDMSGAGLVSHFVSAPFRYFDHIRVTTIRPSFTTFRDQTYDDLKNGTTPARDGGFLVLPRLHPGVAEQRPAAKPFAGQVIVLIDGGTFSTAADVAAQLRSLTKATFIGEETGGCYDGNTSGLNAQVTLPHSGHKLRIQMYGYWNAVAKPAKPGRGTMPDVTVVRTVADTLAGVDAAMDRAFALSKK